MFGVTFTYLRPIPTIVLSQNPDNLPIICCKEMSFEKFIGFQTVLIAHELKDPSYMSLMWPPDLIWWLTTQYMMTSSWEHTLKDLCYNEIRLYAQNLASDLSSIFPPSQHNCPIFWIFFVPKWLSSYIPGSKLKLKLKYFHTKPSIWRSLLTPQLSGTFLSSCCFLI